MDELNAAIERLCEAKGFHFKTFECPPWEADDGPCPWPKHTAGPEFWPKAQAMRRKLIEELDAA